MTPAVFTVAQLAERWQLSPDAIYRYIAAGTLRVLPVPPGTRRPTYRILADSVVAMEAGVAPQPEAPKRKRKPERPGFVRYFGS